MARYGEAFRNRAVARLLPPGSANVGAVAKEIGVSVQTLERWREEVQSRPARGRAWTASARLEAVITAAALDEAGKSTWCREHGIFPHHLTSWEAAFCGEVKEPATGVREMRTLKDKVAKLEREIVRKNGALAEAAALLILQKKFRALWEDEE